MYAELNACMRKLPGACMRILGACLSNCWVHVCGNGWVQSMRLLGACIWKRLGACLTVFACLTVGSLPDSR